ncbi:MAG: hypothetical protein AB1894_05040 [Chloroflexota bacterium]
MSLSAILEVALGLVLVYYALGLIVNLVVGTVKDILDLRAEALEKVLIEAFKLNQDNLFERFSDNTLIQNLRPFQPKFLQIVNRQKTKVSEIPGGTFSLALVDELSSPEVFVQIARKVIEKLLGEQDDPAIQQALDSLLNVESVEQLTDAMQEVIGRLPPGAVKGKLQELSGMLLSTPQARLARLRAGILALPEGPAKKSLLSLLDLSSADVDSFRQRLEGWYNDLMKNVSLVFTQNVRLVVVAVSFVVAFGLGTDSIYVAQSLWTQPTLRAAVVQAAPTFVDQFGSGQVPPDQVESLTPEQKVQLYAERVQEVNLILEKLDSLTIPLTWWQTPQPATAAAWVLRILGLLITTAALSQGSSFWYDILRKINPPPTASTRSASSSEGE